MSNPSPEDNREFALKSLREIISDDLAPHEGRKELIMGKYVLRWVGVLIVASVLPSPALSQGAGDVLNEAPLVPIPHDMTYEEYQDMNRRISTGLTRSIVPGMLHFYAGEPTTGKWLLATGIAGVASIVAGAVLLEEGDFLDTDYDVFVLNAGDKDKERRYEKIPVSLEGGTTKYRLRELQRDPGAGVPLIALGVITIAGSMIYDFLHGIQMIEDKRDRVRFKYGKQLKLQAGVRKGAPRLKLSYAF